MVYHEEDESFNVGVELSRSEKFIYIQTGLLPPCWHDNRSMRLFRDFICSEAFTILLYVTHSVAKRHQSCEAIMLYMSDLLAHAAASVTSEMRYLDASNPDGDFQTIMPRINGISSAQLCLPQDLTCTWEYCNAFLVVYWWRQLHHLHLLAQMWNMMSQIGMIRFSCLLEISSVRIKNCWQLQSPIPRIRR